MAARTEPTPRNVMEVVTATQVGRDFIELGFPSLSLRTTDVDSFRISLKEELTDLGLDEVAIQQIEFEEHGPGITARLFGPGPLLEKVRMLPLEQIRVEGCAVVVKNPRDLIELAFPWLSLKTTDATSFEALLELELRNLGVNDAQMSRINIEVYETAISVRLFGPTRRLERVHRVLEARPIRVGGHTARVLASRGLIHLGFQGLSLSASDVVAFEGQFFDALEAAGVDGATLNRLDVEIVPPSIHAQLFGPRVCLENIRKLPLGQIRVHGSEAVLYTWSVENFAETWLRYFAVDFVGTFMYVMLSDLIRWTEHFQFRDAFKAMNPGPHPTVAMNCTKSDQGLLCDGVVWRPLAGSVLPQDVFVRCIFDGFCFMCCFISAPGATILPHFSGFYYFLNLKDKHTLVPSWFGQLAGVLVANFLMYFLLKDAVALQVTVFQMPEAHVRDMLEGILGLQFPEDNVSNLYAFGYALMSGVMLCFLFMPIATLTLKMHPLAQDMAKGVSMAVFQAGFGLNGLGSMPNPTQWLATAVFLQMMGYDTLSKHNHFALWVPLWVAPLSVLLGALCYRVYIALLYEGRWDCQPRIFSEGRRNWAQARLDERDLSSRFSLRT